MSHNIQHYLSDYSSENLLDDFWGLEKKNFKKMVIVSLIILPLAIIMLSTILIIFLKYRKDYKMVKELKEERREGELATIAQSKEPNEVIKSLMGLYALVDLKSSVARKIIERDIKQLEKLPESTHRDDSLARKTELVSKIPPSKRQVESIDLVRIPNEGTLLEKYWKNKRGKNLFLAIFYTLFFLPFAILFWIQHSNLKKRYQEIKQLRKEGKEEELMQKVKEKRTSWFYRTEIVMMSIFSLADIKSKKLPETITYYLKELDLQGGKGAMASRRGLLAMLTYLEYDETAEGRIDEKADTILSTTQVYFIDELEWGEEKCMITGITLDIRKG
ncbi:MAG: hypothetical protein ACTSQK_09065, partial [Candidatus Heimdallarchaeota archaeon]